MDQRMSRALDDHITGHYGEDQFRSGYETTYVVWWSDGVINEWTKAVTGDSAEIEDGLAALNERGKQTFPFPVTFRYIDAHGLTVSPTETIEDFLARDWSELGATDNSDEPTLFECQCGHPAHGDTCSGTLSTVSDGDWVASEIQRGSDPNEACVCTSYLANVTSYNIGE